MSPVQLVLRLLLVVYAVPLTAVRLDRVDRAAADDPLVVNVFNFWSAFRDPANGLYCDSVYISGNTVCGASNNFYSIASVGMGLVAECVFAELGLREKSLAKQRVLQTMASVQSSWPRSQATGFWQHFTDRSFAALAEYSTIDSAIYALGALFAGNYFGGDLSQQARSLTNSTRWTSAVKTVKSATRATGNIPSSCKTQLDWGFKVGKTQKWYQESYAKSMDFISGVSFDEASYQDFQRMYKCAGMNRPDCNDKGLDFPTTCSRPPCDVCPTSSMYMVAGQGGAMTAETKPYNEYYMLAYLASIAEFNPLATPPEELKLAKRYFEVFFGSSAAPPGDGQYPVYIQYEGVDLLSDDRSRFVPSFTVQFCNFLVSSFGKNPFYAGLLSRAMRADMKFWEAKLPKGSALAGKVWGSGAGIAPAGYQALAINHNIDLVYSAAIMAGFLEADRNYTAQIESQLRYMYQEGVCAYQKVLPSGSKAKILWRCSINKPTWSAPRVESVDFSTMVLGLSQLYLPEGFYQRYAA